MLDVLKLLLKEEYRINTAWVSGAVYFSLPLLFAAMMSLLFGMARFFGAEGGLLAQILLLLSFVIALPSGFVTLLQREMFSHNIGDVSFIISNAYTLPIRTGELLSAFMIKEFVFATAFFVLPVSFAFCAVFGASASALVPAMVLSYAFGVLFSFFLSTIIRKFGRFAFLFILAFIAAVAVQPQAVLPFIFLYTPSGLVLTEDYFAAMVYLLLFLPFADFYYEPKVRLRSDSFDSIESVVKDAFLAKDFVAVLRTGFFPVYAFYQLAIVSAFVSIVRILPAEYFLPYTLGVFAIVPWFILNFLDQPHLYTHLPAKEGAYIGAKLKAFLAASSIGLVSIGLAGMFVKLSFIKSTVIYAVSTAYSIYLTHRLFGSEIQLFLKPKKIFLFLLLLTPAGFLLDASILTNNILIFLLGSAAFALLIKTLIKPAELEIGESGTALS